MQGPLWHDEERTRATRCGKNAQSQFGISAHQGFERREITIMKNFQPSVIHRYAKAKTVPHPDIWDKFGILGCFEEPGK